MKRFEIFFGIIKIPADFIMTVTAFFIAYKVRLITEPDTIFAKPIDYSVLPSLNEYLQFSIGASIVLIIIFGIGKMYSLQSTFSLGKELRKTILLGGVWIMAIITYFFFIRSFPFSRLAIGYSWFFAIALIIAGRTLIKIIQSGFLRMGIGRRRLLFIGENNLTKEISEKLTDNPSYKIIGAIDKIPKLQYTIKKKKIDEIIQTKSNYSNQENQEILELCDLHNITYKFVPDMIEVRRTNIITETIDEIPIISLKHTPLDGWGKVTKRIADMIGATLGLIIFSPVLLITAIAIKIDSRGPIFFNKLDDGSPAKRVGKNGKLFRFHKFRSMHPNTDKLRYTKLASKNTRTDGPLIKIKNDPRVTRVGRFIRKYSIDELPQLWNVLTGDISIVGPRPHLPEEVAKYKNHHRFALTIKPGITGLAQISGRSNLPFEDEAKLDRYYIENWSLFLDIKIVLKTIGVVLKGHQE